MTFPTVHQQITQLPREVRWTTQDSISTCNLAQESNPRRGNFGVVKRKIDLSRLVSILSRWLLLIANQREIDLLVRDTIFIMLETTKLRTQKVVIAD